MSETNYLNEKTTSLMLEVYPAKLLAAALARKIGRRIRSPLGRAHDHERAAMYNGVLVYDRLNLHGEGLTVGQDYPRVLNELGIGRVERMFEFCAGPGYIGYSLLANGFCEKLTLADINPRAVETARKTAKFNRIEDKVNIYRSDCLDDIPASEKWDLVVSNPPHFLPRDARDTDIKAYDPDWSIHKRFYASIKRFMKPGGLVVMQENGKGVPRELTLPMIRDGGGKFREFREGIDVTGRDNLMYYVVSEW